MTFIICLKEEYEQIKKFMMDNFKYKQKWKEFYHKHLSNHNITFELVGMRTK